MPLRLRLGGVFALGAAIVLVVFGVVSLWQLHQGLATSLDGELQNRATELVSHPEEVPHLRPGSAKTHRGLELSENLVQLVDADGIVVRGSPRLGVEPLVSAAVRQRAVRAPVLKTVRVDGQEVRTLTTSAVAGSGDGSVLIVATRSAASEDAVERVRNLFLLAGGPLVLLAGAGGALLAGAALRPVERLREQVAEVSEEDLEGRVDVPGTRDELARLAETMNELLARVRRARTRERGFIADAGHELRTPLAIMRAELELAGRPGRDREELEEAVTVAAEETERLVRLAEDLLLLARSDEASLGLRLQPVDVGGLLHRVQRAAQARAAQRGVEVRVVTAGSVTITADEDRLRQAADNLLDNALRHAPTGSEVELRAAEQESEMVFEVLDRGPGFPVAFLPRAFDRFARADDARTGTTGGSGLGLAIVASIATAHGGRASAANRPGGGAVVRLVLPLRNPPTS